MKKSFLASVAVLALAAGCGGKKTTTPAANPVTELPPPPVHNTMVAPVTVTPPTETSVAPVSAEPRANAVVGAAPVAGQKYKVKKGDTLFSLAQKAYGSGTKYPKIVSANPTVIKNGVLPEGATIMIPN